MRPCVMNVLKQTIASLLRMVCAEGGPRAFRNGMWSGSPGWRGQLIVLSVKDIGLSVSWAIQTTKRSLRDGGSTRWTNTLWIKFVDALDLGSFGWLCHNEL